MIAHNAKPIVDARLRGFKPSDLILVSLVGPIAAMNHVVQARPQLEYDWRWVHGLDVCVYVNDGIEWVHTVKEIALRRPTYLGLWQVLDQWGADVYLTAAEEEIEKPVRDRRTELDFQPWLDFQNIDFIEGRTYTRDAKGMPCAVDP